MLFDIFLKNFLLLNILFLQLIVVTAYIADRKSSMGNRTLFWRAMCDFGVAIRFLLMPAFNIYTCGSAVCHQDYDRGSFIHPQSFITSTIDHHLAYAFV